MRAGDEKEGTVGAGSPRPFALRNPPMAMSCNIDRKGRMARLISGIVLIIAAIVLAFTWARQTESWVAWLVSVATIGLGLFQVFEAWKGWCVMRAMGFKTPM